MQRFIGEMIKLRLPRTPAFDSQSEAADFVATWTGAFARHEIADLRAIWPRIVDRCKTFPTIPDIKAMIAEYYGTQSQFAPKQEGVKQEVLAGELRRIEARSDGYTVTAIGADIVFPATTILTDPQKIQAITPGTYAAKPLAKIDLKTLAVTNPDGTRGGGISGCRLK